MSEVSKPHSTFDVEAARDFANIVGDSAQQGAPIDLMRRDVLAACAEIERLEEQLEAIQKRIEEAVSIMPDPMHPHFPPNKVDAQARAIRLLTLEDPYPASEPKP